MPVRVSEIKTVEIERCIPANPVCLAWMNAAGGWDTYVFGHNQTEGLDTTVGSVTRYPNEELSEATGTHRMHGRRSLPKMTLGAENVDANRIRGITGILKSALVLMLVEWNHPDPPVWMEVGVEPGTFNVFNTSETRQNIEFTIDLAEENVQIT